MSYSIWSSFAYYNTGNIVSYNAINYSALQANVNVVPTTLAPNWVVLPPPSGAGVSSLVGGTGALTMSVVNGSANLVGNDIQLAIAYPTSVTSISDGTTALSNAITLTSPNGTVTITSNSPNIELETTPPFIPALASFYSSTTQALAASALTKLTYDAISITSGNIIAGGTFPTSSIQVTLDGVYKILFSIQVDRTAVLNGDFQAWIIVDGSNVPNTNTQIVVNQNIQTLNTCEFIISLSANQKVEVGCWTNSAGQQALALPISATVPVAIPSIITNIYRLSV